MARRKSSFSKLTHNVKRRRKNPEGGNSSSSGIVDELMMIAKPVGVGLAAYASTRLAGRIAFRLGRKKSEGLGRHLGPWASVGAAAAAVLAAERLESLQAYKTEVAIGAGIAAIQGLLQTYVPQYAWIMNDYHLDELAAGPVEPGAPAQQRRVASSARAPQGAPAQAQDDDGGIDVDDFSDIPGFDGASFKTGIFS